MHNCYVFIGPSGSGKTTIAAKAFLPEQKIITHTSRSPRKNEQEGIDYFFVSKETFQEMIQKDQLVEWDCYADNYYGTSKAELTEKLAENDCYAALTASGFWHFRKQYGAAIVPVFIQISEETLEKRLEARGETAATITKRVALFQNDQKQLEKLRKIPELILLDNNGEFEESVAAFKAALQKKK
ncbi:MULTISPECIES: guanylate kinase [unclassified Enterococcus]|jgi:guanylate kinase|uniref:guanylate kinase n=1 Tax=unclassified Enterococcus TaxID=2608891 RepID=UPI003D2B4750